jgi:hypothetical protein
MCMRDTRNHVELNVTWIRFRRVFFPTNYLCILFSRSETPETTGRVNLGWNEADARERIQLQQHTHSPQPSWVHHAHRCALCLFVPDGCALTRYFSFQAHDWFSDVLTGGLILGLWISYLPQVTSFSLSPRVNIENEVD